MVSVSLSVSLLSTQLDPLSFLFTTLNPRVLSNYRQEAGSVALETVILTINALEEKLLTVQRGAQAAVTTRSVKFSIRKQISVALSGSQWLPVASLFCNSTPVFASPPLLIQSFKWFKFKSNF